MGGGGGGFCIQEARLATRATPLHVWPGRGGPRRAAWTDGSARAGRAGCIGGRELLRSPTALKNPVISLAAIMPRHQKLNINFVFFWHFPAKLGPETHANWSGSKNGAELIQN